MGKALKSRPRATPKKVDEADDCLTHGRESQSAAHPRGNVIGAFLAMPPIEQAQQIRQGMDANVARSVSRDLLNVSLPVLLRSLRLSPSVVRRKISSCKPLSASESDLIARTVLIHELATDVLENPKLASEWMLKRNIHLRDEAPLDMLDTQTGYDCVRSILLRLAYGICA
ncbi:antitoxin Xre/MbcA/ParS toxin-binding domain-containing protein [Paraburkholderia nemoris]|uniref:antitoxin Xre/MbcA/ParS toxin-binding domain-containing protein n=1 Tax=Paraburkholderia nemoris TaxID=2793076 RepID=UPI0038B7D471